MNNFLKIFSLPASWLYRLAIGIRNGLYNSHFIHTTDAPLPSICVGNLAVGGTGKTPMVEYLIRLLSPHYKIAVLSRGYKRATRGFVLADPNATAASIGDEPLQLHRKFPNIVVAVCADRVMGIKRLRQAFPDLQLVILDDAFQHRRIRCGLNILLTAADRLYVDDHYLPYGRLRDAKSQSLRADIIVVTKCPEGLQPIDKRLIDTRLHLPSYQSLFFSTIGYPEIPTGGRVLLVTAIAHPEYLKRHLRTLFPNIETLYYPDHHVLNRNELRFLEQKAKYYDRVLTTEKDMARLAEAPLSDALRDKLESIPILTQIDKHEAFDRQVLTYVRENIRKR